MRWPWGWLMMGAGPSWQFHGRPVKPVDGSTVAMLGTPENQAA